jgi:hypothetical protein
VLVWPVAEVAGLQGSATAMEAPMDLAVLPTGEAQSDDAPDHTPRNSRINDLLSRREIFERGQRACHRIDASFASTPAVWFGVGVVGRGLTRGLPIDVAIMVLAQEVLRRELGLARAEIVVADENAIAAGWSELEVRRTTQRTQAVLQRLVDALGSRARVFRASTLPDAPARRRRADELRTAGVEPYVALQLAQMETMRRRGAGIKLGWTLGPRARDEASCDALYARHVAPNLSTIYTPAGRSLDARRPRACPYVCSDPAARILLEPDEAGGRQAAGRQWGRASGIRAAAGEDRPRAGVAGGGSGATRRRGEHRRAGGALRRRGRVRPTAPGAAAILVAVLGCDPYPDALARDSDPRRLASGPAQASATADPVADPAHDSARDSADDSADDSEPAREREALVVLRAPPVRWSGPVRPYTRERGDASRIARPYWFDAPVYQAPDARRRVVGVVRRNTELPVADAVAGGGCSGHWYRLVGGGYVCRSDGYAISSDLDPLPPEIRTRPPGHESPLPYVYARVRRGEPPIYGRLPTRAELDAGSQAAVRGTSTGAHFVAIDAFVEHEGLAWVRTVKGHYLRMDDVEVVPRRA